MTYTNLLIDMNKIKSTKIAIPDSMVRAVQSLLCVAEGNGTSLDLAEIALAINAGATDWGGIVWYEEKNTAVRELRKRAYKFRNSSVPEDWDEAERLDQAAEDLIHRWEIMEEAVSRIPPKRQGVT